jgi:hypothetical protein
MDYGTPIVILLLAISLLVSAVLTNTTVIYAQHVPTNTQQVPSSISKLHSVKITSPTKGQQVPIGKDLTVSGIYTASNPTASNCQVFVIANGVKPYQPVTGTGPGGASDYSRWSFVLTSKYTTIKQGPNNKITAKYTCSDNPGIASFHSVNITGVAATTKQQEQQNVTSSNNEATTNNNTITTQQNKPAVYDYARSTILPYLISNNTAFLGNDGIGSVSGIEYLGYRGTNNATQLSKTTFLGNDGIGSVSGIEYLGYHGSSSGSRNHSPIATSGGVSTDYPKSKAPRHGVTSSSYNGDSGSGDSSSKSTDYPKSKAPRHGVTSSSYNGDRIGNNSTSAVASTSTAAGITKFGFNPYIFPFY